MIFVPYVASARSVLGAVGDEKLKGVLSTDTVKDTTDLKWANDPGVKAYVSLIEKYVSESDRVSDCPTAGGYMAAQAVADVLRRARDDLTRANIMKIASHMDHWTYQLYLPGISLNTSPDNFFPMRVNYMKRFHGTRWEIIGNPITE